MSAVSELLRGVTDDATKLRREVEQAAVNVSCAMAVIHGGEWRIDIAHEYEFVLISRVRS